jgi:hypothetical protein
VQFEESLMFRRKMLLASSPFLESQNKGSKKAEAVSTTQLFMSDQVNETKP